MVYFIKNMVCNRCKKAVRELFEKQGHAPLNVELGEVVISDSLTKQERETIQSALIDLGFELIDDKRVRLIEQVKSVIIELVHERNAELNETLSDLIRHKTHHDYNYLSNLFSDVEGITIEKYFIAQKIEKVKELLKYDELTLSEISFQLNYSSVAYLSSQFKNVTGLTPTAFKKLKGSRRRSLDEL